MSKRPYVICHMIATIDGKILSRRWSRFAVSKAVGGLYDDTAAEFEVGSWLVGTKTMLEFFDDSKALKQPTSPVAKGNFIANRDALTFAIALDANGSIRFDDNEVGGDHIIILTTEKVSAAYKAHLRELGISYLICGRDRINFAAALETIQKEFKIKRILLEGGGLINGAMLQEGLIDEISQLIVPIVDGGGAEVSGLYDLRTKAPGNAACELKLIEQRTLKHGTQWLRYRVKHSQSK